MAIFFVFSDEAGCYRQNRWNKFLKSHPFYVRAALIISADDWIRLNSKYLNIKEDYGIPKDKEFKWSFIWSLKKSKDEGTLTEKDEYYFLKNSQKEI